MIKPITSQEYLLHKRHLPIIDVRAPAEYAHGHIPGAFNVALFSDEERAIVGTIYKQHGRETAVKKGFEIVAPHITSFIDKIKIFTEARELVLYCARGGMRSRSIAMLLDFAGYTIHLMTGGFKAYKQFLRERSTLFNTMILIGGKTGSGKTAILAELARLGEQVLDLESVANHRGSALGALGRPIQPTQEQFIITCLTILAGYDPVKCVWLEHEGTRLGEVQIPIELLVHMSCAPVVHINLPRAYRAARLMEEYGCFSVSEIRPCVEKMEQRLGSEATRKIIELLDIGSKEAVLDLLIDHYDRSYLHNMQRNKSNTFFPLELDATSPLDHALSIQKFVAGIKNNVRSRPAS